VSSTRVIVRLIGEKNVRFCLIPIKGPSQPSIPYLFAGFCQARLDSMYCDPKTSDEGNLPDLDKISP
jgi:hypothetical protein